ncbi:MAG TPA: integration host factor, actinobacterial type [Pseudonocardia sp.]|jgi:hypothetical protein
MALPRTSHEQRNADAEQAVTVRQVRSGLIDHVKAGDASIEVILERAATDPVVAKTKISQLVQALPGYGPSKAAAVLTDAGIAMHSRVEQLEPRERTALITALDERP